MRHLGLWMTLLAVVVCGEVAPLPDEAGSKAAVTYAPFPSRMHQFVWRNWTVVPQERLAEVLRTTPERVAQVADSMGLAAQGVILPEWQDKGYITVLRRNWHILPYEQLTQLLGFSRERLRYALMEDDFLFIKLGRVKPKCEVLLYEEPKPEVLDAAAQLAAVLHEEKLGKGFEVCEEPRFEFIKSFMQPDPNLKIVRGDGESPFELRYIFSYCADYGDILSDPQVSSYPEGLLQQLAAVGVNGVYVHTVLNTLASDPAFPEFGKGHEKRLEGLRTLVARGKRYGVDIYLYLNEPRAMHNGFFAAKPERAAMRGVKFDSETSRMCTTHPEVRRWMADATAKVFKEVPGLGGIFTITASENPTSCASHHKHTECEHCRGRLAAEIIAEVNATLMEGMRRSNPTGRMIAWDWGWRDEQVPDIVARLPKECWVQSVSEWSLPIERGGVKSVVGEYSISSVGPGPRATRHWEIARKAGHKTAAKVQVGATWEFSAVPYLPTLDLVAEHARNLVDANVDGVMLSWSLGCYPSPNLEVFQAFTKGGRDIEGVLGQLAQKRYGAAAAPLVRQAWKTFSDGFREFPYHITTVYTGPQHVGVANPLWLEPTGYSATMVGIPYDDLKTWRAIYPEDVWIAQLDKVRNGFARGCAIWGEMLGQVCESQRLVAQREYGLFRAIELHFESCVNQARFVQARESWRQAQSASERDAARARMREVVAAELATARRLLPFALADSRIGYESSNHYFYVPQDLMEKILNCREILGELKAGEKEREG